MDGWMGEELELQYYMMQLPFFLAFTLFDLERGTKTHPCCSWPHPFSPPFHHNNQSSSALFSETWQTTTCSAQVTLSTSRVGSGHRGGARRRRFKAPHVKRLPLQRYPTLHLHIHIFGGQNLPFLPVQDEEISGHRVSVFPIRFKGSLS